MSFKGLNYFFNVIAVILFIACMAFYAKTGKVDFLVFAVIYLIHSYIFSQIDTRGE